MIEVRIQNADLAQRIEDAIGASLDAARAAYPPSPRRTVRLRTRRRLEQLGASIEGRLVIVRVTAKNARRLPALVEDIRASRPCGVQLVWDGVEPARDLVEKDIFAVLERARSTPAGPPVVLARTDAPAEALLTLISWKERS